MNKFLSIAVTFFFATFNALAADTNAPIEISTLLEKAAHAQSQGMISWDFLADASSPVKWETSGINSNGERTGQALIAVNGFVPKVLRQNIELGTWSITLSGDKFGASRLSLSNSSCFGSHAVSENCFDLITQFTQSFNKVGLKHQAQCEFGPGGSKTTIYSVQPQNAEPIFAAITVNAASGGTTIDATVIPKSSDSSNVLTHATSICVSLFNQNLGDASNNFLSYEFLRE